MRKFLNLWSVGIVVTLMLTVSCSKDGSQSTDYLNEILGTYQGTYTSSNTLKSGNTATAEVSTNSDSTLFIHCYGDELDTTIIMDAYENGDSIMVCSQSEDFQDEYGGMSFGRGMMMMGSDDNETEWQHHMAGYHNEGNLHYGGFDMKMHSFEYSYRMMGDSTYYIKFQGSK